MIRRVLILTLLLYPCCAQAVILSTREQRNTRAPTGPVENSGWQWLGQWGNFSGTVISKNTFITAGHVGGNVGEYFTYGGRRYQTTAMYDDPLSDLRIWGIRARLTSAAPLQVEKNEGGKGIMIYGRGTQRGEEVVVNGQLKGWLWGEDDHVQSWGKNVINGVSSGLADNGTTKVDAVKLYWNFDRVGVSHEGGLSLGDSGGPVFLKSATNVWRLAGVNYAAQYLYTVPPDPQDMRGTIVDAGGLKFGDTFINDVAQDIPTRMYATRISARTGWINDVLAGRVAPTDSALAASVAQAVPEPGGVAIFIAATGLCLRRRLTKSQ